MDNKIFVFFVDGFEMVEALTIVDLLRRAALQVVTVSLKNTDKVTSSHGVEIKTDTIFDNCDFNNKATYILPGGPGTSTYLQHNNLLELLKDNYNKGNLIAAICAAPSILEQIGILHMMTVFPSMKDEITNYTKKAVVVDGNIITGEALGASIPFSLAIIKYLRNEKAANDIKEMIVYGNDYEL